MERRSRLKGHHLECFALGGRPHYSGEPISVLTRPQENKVLVGGFMSPVNDSYGKAGLLPAAQRLEMCQLAASSSDLIMVSRAGSVVSKTLPRISSSAPGPLLHSRVRPPLAPSR